MDLEVGGAGLHHVLGQSEDPLAQLARCVQHHAVRQRRRTTTAGTDERERRHVGVAEHDLHVFGPDTELVDRDLRQRRLVALSVGLLAGDDADAAVVLQGDVG